MMNILSGAEPLMVDVRQTGGSPVLRLSQDLNIRVINAATGELLRELALDYQPTGKSPGRKKKTP
jgi:hypothetical protein